MKKLLYNQARNKIFNLDQVVCIEHINCSGYRGIILQFPNNNYFFVTYNQTAMNYILIRMQRDDVCSSFRLGNFEINVKLFEYFEHKFTKSALCQKGRSSEV